MLVTNHPQLAGGSHLPDITVITPVFEAGDIVFYVASRGQRHTAATMHVPACRARACLPAMHVPVSFGPSAPFCGQRRRAALQGAWQGRSLIESSAGVALLDRC